MKESRQGNAAITSRTCFGQSGRQVFYLIPQIVILQPDFEMRPVQRPLTSSIKQLRHQLSALSLSPSLIRAEGKLPQGEVRVYKQVEGRELKLFSVRPEGWTATDKRSAIVFYHGDGWASGTSGQYNEHSAYIASRGLVCIKVKYRSDNRG